MNDILSPAGLPGGLSAPPRRPGRGLLWHLSINTLALGGAAMLGLIYEHDAAGGHASQGYLPLGAAALLALMPLRSILGFVWRVEGSIMHWVHGLSGVTLFAALAGGGLANQPLLTHAALAPFAMMGAAQAIMHQRHPRNARQAEALRRFASSLPQVEQFTRGSLRSPANAQRAVAVLRDLIGKAQTLGYTELDADPGLQSALRQRATRVGLTLALDRMQQLVATLASNPASAAAAPDLQRRLDAARRLTERAP